MPNLELLVRGRQSRDTSPPRRAGGLDCADEPRTVTLVFGAGGRGKIFTINYSVSVKRYMTKQQREIIEDE